jgi:hypothetical protein
MMSSITIQGETYLTREQTAKLLLRTTRALARWEQYGYGPRVTRISRTPFYREGELAEWLLMADDAEPEGRARRGDGYGDI